MLATIFRRKEAIVNLALKTFEEFGMIEIINDAITIPNWSKHQTLDQLEERKEYMRNYMQKYREKQRLLTDGESKVNCKVYSKANVNSLDKEEEIEEEIDKDKNKKKIEPKKKYGEYKNVLLTDKELQSLKSDYGNYNDLITYLDEYIEMKGYKAKSHYLCIKKWVVDAVQKKGASTNNIKGKYSDEELDRLLNNPAPTEKYDIDEMIAKGEII